MSATSKPGRQKHSLAPPVLYLRAFLLPGSRLDGRLRLLLLRSRCIRCRYDLVVSTVRVTVGARLLMSDRSVLVVGNFDTSDKPIRCQRIECRRYARQPTGCTKLCIQGVLAGRLRTVSSVVEKDSFDEGVKWNCVTSVAMILYVS